MTNFETFARTVPDFPDFPILLVFRQINIIPWIEK